MSEPKIKKTKDPLKPKRPLNSYLLYSIEQRPILKQANPLLKNTELSQLIASTWKDASDLVKQPFVDQHSALKLEYDQLMLSYVPIESTLEAPLPTTVKPKKVKQKKDPNAPIKPQTAYVAFAAATRPLMKTAHPDADFGAINKLLGDSWKSLPNDIKLSFTGPADLAKQNYDAELKAYTESLENVDLQILDHVDSLQRFADEMLQEQESAVDQDKVDSLKRSADEMLQESAEDQEVLEGDEENSSAVLDQKVDQVVAAEAQFATAIVKKEKMEPKEKKAKVVKESKAVKEKKEPKVAKKPKAVKEKKEPKAVKKETKVNIIKPTDPKKLFKKPTIKMQETIAQVPIKLAPIDDLIPDIEIKQQVFDSFESGKEFDNKLAPLLFQEFQVDEEMLDAVV